MRKRLAQVLSVTSVWSAFLLGNALPLLAAEDLTVSQIESEAKKTRDFDKALERLQQLVTRQPRNAKAYLVAGQMLEARGYGLLAEQLYQKADQCDPSGPESNLRTFYLKLHEDGVKAAADYLGYVVERFPDDPGVLLMQGMIARLHHHYPEAEYFYERAQKLHPEMTGTRTALASLRMVSGKYGEALKLVDEELAAHPSDLSAALAKGQILVLLGRAPEAIPYLERAYGFKTTSVLVDKRMIANMLMSAHSLAGNNAEALEYGFKTLAATRGRDHKSMMLIKLKLVPLLRSFPDAEILNIEATIERQCTSVEQLATLRFALADILDVDGHAEAAVHLYRRGLELMPSAARGHYRLGTRLIKDRDYANGYLYAREAYLENPTDSAIVNTYVRFNQRLNNRKRDIAWELKDLLRGGCVTDLVGAQPLFYTSL